MFPVSTNGIVEEKIITLSHTGLVAADEGKPVTISASNTVALAGDGDLIFGVIQKVEPNVCSVLIQGVVTLLYTDTAPGLSYTPLAVNATAGVKVDSGSRIQYRVLSVDVPNTKVTFILK